MEAPACRAPRDLVVQLGDVGGVAAKEEGEKLVEEPERKWETQHAKSVSRCSRECSGPKVSNRGREEAGDHESGVGSFCFQEKHETPTRAKKPPQG